MTRGPGKLAAGAVALLIAGCGGGEPGQEDRTDGRAPTAGATARSVFADITVEAGIDFMHESGARGDYRLPEEMGPGGAFLDYDGDGDPDIYLVQGGLLDGHDDTHRNRLYRNDGGGRFADVSEGSGADLAGYGLGAAAADYDADGDADLYVTRLGPNVLLRNDAGRFTDVTEAAGVGDPGFGTSAAFLDYDRDGRTDLFVVNYVDWSPHLEAACFDPAGARDYCSPVVYEAPTTDRLFRSIGGGRFEDVTDGAGIGSARGNGLGVICSDFDGDGRVDVYVANDQTPAFLWMNRGDGTFVEDATFRGCAFNADGMAIAGMGTAAEDLDGDGDFDLVVTNIRDQSHLCLRNEDGVFEDVSHEWGFADWSVPHTGFGIRLFDQDHDGELDGLIANGAVNRWTEPFRADNPFAEPNHFVRRNRSGRFIDGGGEAQPVLSRAEMSRGVFSADIDADGDLDLLVTNNRGPARLLRNDNDTGYAWTIVDLVARDGARPALNAVVRIDAGGRSFLREVRPHAGYLGSSDGAIHAGLARAVRIDSLIVRWPDGASETWRELPVNEPLRLRQGESSPVTARSGAGGS